MDAGLLGVIVAAVRSVSKRADLTAITADSLLVEDLGLDSLDLVGVFMKLEDEFGLQIDLDEVAGLRTVADLGRHLDGLRASQPAAA